MSMSYRVVRLAPSSRISASMVIACAGQMASQSVLATEARREVALLKGVVDDGLLLEKVDEGEGHAADQLAHQQRVRHAHQRRVGRGRTIVRGTRHIGVEAA